MARTPIPPDLIRQPEEAQRDAARFDYLCQLVEEIALPVVWRALERETAAAGAEVLTEEARIALQVLAGDPEILRELDEEEILQHFETSLTDEIPKPDEEEARLHTRDFSQVLTSAWLELLRRAESETKIVILSDHLVPRESSNGASWVMKRFGVTPELPSMLLEAVGWFAVDEADVAKILRTLRAQLFAEPRVVDLPFNLLMAGRPRESAMALSRQSLDKLVEAMKRYGEDAKVSEVTFEPAYDYEDAVAVESDEFEAFATPATQDAVEALTEPLPAAHYACLVRVADPTSEEDSIEARVLQVLSAS
jgi:hypothetical protein